MKARGLNPFRVSHRLSAPNASESKSKSIALYKEDNSIVILPEIINKSSIPLTINKLKKGTKFMKDDVLVKNFLIFRIKTIIFYILFIIH